jgi:hypothetical protein
MDKVYRICGTCGYECTATLDNANDEHMAYDGAHYPIWYTIEEMDALT